MAAKRKRDSGELNILTPASKVTKSEEVTRSGRVRKRPAKFHDGEEEEEELAPVVPKTVPSTPVAPKPVQPVITTKSPPIKTEPVILQAALALQSPVAQKTTSKSAKLATVPLSPVQTEIKSEMVPASPDSADDVSKASSRGGRMRKKSAKVLEMEEFEEAERKTQSKKSLPSEPIKKPAHEVTPVPQEVLPPKKAYKSTTNAPQLVTAALAAKLASSTPPVSLKIKDIPVLASPQAVPVKTEVMSPIKIKADIPSPVKGKSGTQLSPRNASSTIRLDQASEQDKGSVIKLLLSSPAQSTNPVLSTKSVAGTSPPVEKPAVSTKKKSKAKDKAAASVLETSPTDLPNLKLALSTPSSMPPSSRLLVDPNLIKQELIMSADAQQQALKLKSVLSPEGALVTAASTQQMYITSPVKTEAVKTDVKTPPPPKSAAKAKKKKSSSGSEVQVEQEMKFSPTQMITPNVVHVQNAPSTSGLITDDHHLPPKKKKSAKVKIDSVEEPEKSLIDHEFDIDLSALGDAGDESLMELDDDSLMISEEDLEQVKPPKSAKKKKTKAKGSTKKGMIQMGDIPSSTESELVMDWERMKQDDRKKKKQTKSAAAAEVEQTKKKRAPTAYMLWCSANRQRVVNDNPGIDFSTISKTLGEMWSGLSDKDKMMWKRKAKKAGGKGSTLIQTGKNAALAKQQAQAQPVPIRHGGHNPNAQKATAAMTAAMLTKTAKQAADDIPIKGFGADPVDVAAHLKIVGESLSIIGMRLQEHRGLIAVQGSLSVLLDSMLCAMAPLLCLTNQVEELNGCSHQTHMKSLDNIAYIMPGL